MRRKKLISAFIVLVVLLVFNITAFAGDWVKMNSNGTKVWVDTSHYETRQKWVTSGYWDTRRVWVPEQGHYERYWVDTSHWETRQRWVPSGYYKTERVWVDTSHYEDRKVWVDTSHYEYRKVWVSSGYWKTEAVWVPAKGHYETRYVGGWGYGDWKAGGSFQTVWVVDIPAHWEYRKTWVDTSHYETQKVWVNSGYYKTEKVWVNSGYWDTRQVWVDTSHYETYQEWVTSGYWAQRWVVDVPGHYETRQVWVDTSHYETYQEWVQSGYWDEVHGSITISKTPQYVFTNKHTRSDGTPCDMTLNISYNLNKKVTNIRAIHVINRYQDKGVMYVEPYSAVKNVGGTSGSAVLKFQYDKPGDENSTMYVYFDLEGGGSLEVRMNIPVNGIYSDSKFNLPDPVLKKSVKDSETVSF